MLFNKAPKKRLFKHPLVFKFVKLFFFTAPICLASSTKKKNLFLIELKEKPANFLR